MESQYLCNCGNLLYVDVNSREEFCLNKICSNCVKETIKDNVSPAKDVFERKTIKYVSKIRTFSKDDFLYFLFNLREKIINNLFVHGKLDLISLFGLNELIMLTNSITVGGRAKSQTKFMHFTNNFIDFIKNANFLDDIESKRYVLAGNRVLVLKYSKVFNNMFENYGIINESREFASTVNKFETIDSNNKFESDYKFGDDLKKYYKIYYRLMIMMNYLLNYHYRQSLYVKYKFDPKEIALMISMYVSMKSSTFIVSPANLKKHMGVNNVDKDIQKQFVKHFCTTKDQIPIFLKLKNGYLLGEKTLQLFIFYLIGNYSKDLIQEGKEVASLVFEDDLRTKLKNSGYFVPFDVEFSLTKKSLSNDIIAILNSDKKVILIEVKYQDLSPSSINGLTLIDQEINKNKGLKNMSIKHNERLQFFKENVHEYSKKIGIDLEGYDIEAILVTKFEPLISKYNDVLLMDYDAFLKHI